MRKKPWRNFCFEAVQSASILRSAWLLEGEPGFRTSEKSTPKEHRNDSRDICRAGESV